MSAVFDSGNSAQAVPGSGQAARVSLRAAAIALAVVVATFGVAYAFGSTSKTTSSGQPSGQLAPVSALQGQSSVHVAVPGAAGAIPALVQAAKSRPAHHAPAAAQTQAGSNQTQSTPTQSTSSQTVTQQPVTQQPVVQQPVHQQPVVQQPVQHPQQPVVVVHH